MLPNRLENMAAVCAISPLFHLTRYYNHRRSYPNFSAILPLSKKGLVIDWAADRLMLGDGDVVGMR